MLLVDEGREKYVLTSSLLECVLIFVSYRDTFSVRSCPSMAVHPKTDGAKGRKSQSIQPREKQLSRAFPDLELRRGLAGSVGLATSSLHLPLLNLASFCFLPQLLVPDTS